MHPAHGEANVGEKRPSTPSSVTSISCDGDRIGVGCATGDVLHLCAAGLIEQCSSCRRHLRTTCLIQHFSSQVRPRAFLVSPALYSLFSSPAPATKCFQLRQRKTWCHYHQLCLRHKFRACRFFDRFLHNSNTSTAQLSEMRAHHHTYTPYIRLFWRLYFFMISLLPLTLPSHGREKPWQLPPPQPTVCLLPPASGACEIVSACAKRGAWVNLLQRRDVQCLGKRLLP